MGHFLKWVTLAGIIALGDFQIVKVECFLRTNCSIIYVKNVGCGRKKLEEIQKEVVSSQSNNVSYPFGIMYMLN